MGQCASVSTLYRAIVGPINSRYGIETSGEKEYRMSQRLIPGTRVRNPLEPEWGIGQIQSVIGNRVTVNFENAGKRLINSDVVALETIEEDW